MIGVKTFCPTKMRSTETLFTYKTIPGRPSIYNRPQDSFVEQDYLSLADLEHWSGLRDTQRLLHCIKNNVINTESDLIKSPNQIYNKTKYIDNKYQLKMFHKKSYILHFFSFSLESIEISVLVNVFLFCILIISQREVILKPLQFILGTYQYFAALKKAFPWFYLVHIFRHLL